MEENNQSTNLKKESSLEFTRPSEKNESRDQKTSAKLINSDNLLSLTKIGEQKPQISFSAAEKSLLTSLVDNCQVVQCPDLSAAEKEKAWELLTLAFNDKSLEVERSTEALQNFWCGMTHDARNHRNDATEMMEFVECDQTFSEILKKKRKRDEEEYEFPTTPLPYNIKEINKLYFEQQRKLQLLKEKKELLKVKLLNLEIEEKTKKWS